MGQLPYPIREVPIAEQVCQGSELAFARIYEQYFYPLIHYGRQFSKDETLVEDSIQDVFVNVWNSPHQLAQIKSVKAYLFASLRRKIFEKLKEEKRNDPKNHASLPFERVLPYEAHLIARQTELETRGKLSQEIDQLTRRQRETLYLIYYDNLTYEEAAQVMDVKVKAVYNLVYEAIKKLRTHLSYVSITATLFPVLYFIPNLLSL